MHNVKVVAASSRNVFRHNFQDVRQIVYLPRCYAGAATLLLLPPRQGSQL
jgi:hypothetical protein